MAVREQMKPKDRKTYDREFLLSLQFAPASMTKPEGLPDTCDIVLDKANETPLHQLDPSRPPRMNCGPDCTPSFAKLSRSGTGGGSRGAPPSMDHRLRGPRHSQQIQMTVPRKIIKPRSFDIQLQKADNPWKRSAEKAAAGGGEETEEQKKTQELFVQVISILNKLSPSTITKLKKQLKELTIDTDERLNGVTDLTFEKAISEPSYSKVYAEMCDWLRGLRVQTTGAVFRTLLLNRCKEEFEKDNDDDEIIKKKQEELDAASEEEEKQRLIQELKNAKSKAKRRSLGNTRFIGELFKVKMLADVVVHDCIVKLLKKRDEESLECLCTLLSTIGKQLDLEKAKFAMAQYFNQMEMIIKEGKTTSRICFMLQDVLDLRDNNWVPRRGDQNPKTIGQIHKEAEEEELREQMKVQQQPVNRRESGGRPGGMMTRAGSGGRGGPQNTNRGAPPCDDGWNSVPPSKNKSKLTKTPGPPLNHQSLAPGGKGTCRGWGKASSGGTSAKPAGSGSEAGGRPTTNTQNRFSALQSSSSGSSLDSRVPQSSSRERGDKSGRSEEERSRQKEHRVSGDAGGRVASMTDGGDKGSRESARSKENAKREAAPTPPPAPTPSNPSLTEKKLNQKSTAIIEEYLHSSDMKEALQCVQELNSTEMLFVFVRSGLDLTLDRRVIDREKMGLLLHQLLKTGVLPTLQYFKGLQEVLDVAEDMATDIPQLWLYLAELIKPTLHEGGIPMGRLFREISKPLIPLGKAGVLLVQILTLLCKEMSPETAGAMWRDAGLRWKYFLLEDEDVNKFVTKMNVGFTLADESEKSRKELNPAELTTQLDRLIQDKADNQRVSDWIEANLDEQQTSSNMFVRALVRCICQSVVICDNPFQLGGELITLRAELLQKYLKDEQKELQALYALQALMVQMEPPPKLMRVFFNTLYDKDVIKEAAFYKWESSKDPEEMQGKGVFLKPVTPFFTWLRLAEDESDNN